jgi:two-component system nitrate/nitrite response regulator NarL
LASNEPQSLTTAESMVLDQRGPFRPLRVAIVEDHRLLSASLAAVLTAEGHHAFVPSLSSLCSLEAFLYEVRPEITLLDLDLGRYGTGRDVLPLALGAGSTVIVVTGTVDDVTVGECLCLGAYGWLSKASSYDELLEAVLAASRGEPILDPAERDRLMRCAREHRQASKKALAPFTSLSQREAAVLGMLLEGHPVERIASASYVSVTTVRTQVQSILRKLGAKSQLEAVALANKVGWTGPATPKGT